MIAFSGSLSFLFLELDAIPAEAIASGLQSCGEQEDHFPGDRHAKDPLREYGLSAFSVPPKRNRVRGAGHGVQ